MELIFLILVLAIVFIWILETLFVVIMGALVIMAILISGVWNEFKKICHTLLSSRHYKGKN